MRAPSKPDPSHANIKPIDNQNLDIKSALSQPDPQVDLDLSWLDQFADAPPDDPDLSWLEPWNKLKTGMTEDEVLKLLGRPDELKAYGSLADWHYNKGSDKKQIYIVNFRRQAVAGWEIRAHF